MNSGPLVTHWQDKPSIRTFQIDVHPVVELDFTRADPNHDYLQLLNSDLDWQRELGGFLDQWYQAIPVFSAQTSGSTGQPKTIHIEKTKALLSAQKTGRYFGIQAQSLLLLPMHLKYIGARMMVIRAFLHRCKIWIVPPSARIPNLNTTIDFAACVPMQLIRTLDEHETRAVENIHKLLLGGEAVSQGLSERVQFLATEIYSSYGMTETISHCAIRPVNGPSASEYYEPLEGFDIFPDAEHRICIRCPEMFEDVVRSNDIGAWNGERFVVKGRTDNAINSGGVKVHPEEVERKLAPYIQEAFSVLGLPDAVLGERVVLVIEGKTLYHDVNRPSFEELDRYERPKSIYYLDQLPRLENGKIDRLGLKKRIEESHKS